MKNQFLISKIFTIPYFDTLLQKEHVPDSFMYCITHYTNYNRELTYGKAINDIYQYMDRDYRNEYYFKNTIMNQLLVEKHDLYNTAALSELPIAGSKADIIMINGKGIVYEIKTDLDNLQRLEKQIQNYYKVFSYVNVVAGEKQVKKIIEYLRKTKVGVYELTNTGKLVCRKKAYCNREDLCVETMFRILRKKEFESIILDYYDKLPQVNSFEYYRECLKWLKKVNILGLQRRVMKILKQRTLLPMDDLFEIKVPNELRYYVYFSNRYRSNYNALSDFLSQKVEV